MTWHDDAACKGMDMAVFFPTKGQTLAAAKAVCAVCPVRDECLQDALSDEVRSRRFGVRGGLSPRQRDKLPTTLEGRRRARVAKCGTDAGYSAHRNRGEEACRLCKDAHAADERRRTMERSA